MPTTPGCIIIPYVGNLAMTRQAVEDAQAQSVASQLLLVNHGGTEALGLSPTPQQLLFDFPVPFPGLAALWNWSLDLAWALGHEDAMVWNNDVRVAPGMYTALRVVADRLGLWFTTPVNVRDMPQVHWRWELRHVQPDGIGYSALGGPDFSCFLIRRECHQRYRFDERFQPAWHEDNDYHRRLWLGGDGARIAGTPLPYLHYGASTLKEAETSGRATRLHAGFLRSQERYCQKWGGLPHQERRVTPDSEEDLTGVGTPGGYLTQPQPQPQPPLPLPLPLPLQSQEVQHGQP